MEQHPCLSKLHEARKVSPTKAVCEVCGEEAVITIKGNGKMIEWDWDGKPKPLFAEGPA